MIDYLIRGGWTKKSRRFTRYMTPTGRWRVIRVVFACRPREARKILWIGEGQEFSRRLGGGGKNSPKKYPPFTLLLVTPLYLLRTTSRNRQRKVQMYAIFPTQEHDMQQLDIGLIYRHKGGLTVFKLVFSLQRKAIHVIEVPLHHSCLITALRLS